MFGPKCKFCTIYALNIFKYQKYVFIIILTKHKSIIMPEKAKCHKLSEDLYLYFRKNDFLKSFSYNGPYGRKLIFKN